jgi:hypothetical protein
MMINFRERHGLPKSVMTILFAITIQQPLQFIILFYLIYMI